MKEWGSDPDEKPDGWLRLEAAVLAVFLLVAYAMIIHYVLV